MNEKNEEPKVRYVKILANPGFLKCKEPECEHEEAVRANWVYDHAWNKHRTNFISIEVPQQKES